MSRKWYSIVVSVVAATTPSARADWPPPPPQREPPAEEQAADPTAIPERFLERASGYEEGRTIQEHTQADMVLFITYRTPAGAKQRSQRVENNLLRDSTVQEFLKDYVKVKLTLPSDPDTRELAENFRPSLGPNIYVVRPNGFRMQIGLFDRSGRQPRLIEPDEFISLVRERGTPPEQREKRLQRQREPRSTPRQ